MKVAALSSGLRITGIFVSVINSLPRLHHRINNRVRGKQGRGAHHKRKEDR